MERSNGATTDGEQMQKRWVAEKGRLSDGTERESKGSGKKDGESVRDAFVIKEAAEKEGAGGSKLPHSNEGARMRWAAGVKFYGREK